MDMLLVVGVQITLINSSRHNKGEVILYKKIGALLLKEQVSTTNVLRGEPREEIQWEDYFKSTIWGEEILE